MLVWIPNTHAGQVSSHISKSDFFLSPITNVPNISTDDDPYRFTSSVDISICSDLDLNLLDIENMPVFFDDNVVSQTPIEGFQNNNCINNQIISSSANAQMDVDESVKIVNYDGIETVNSVIYPNLIQTSDLKIQKVIYIIHQNKCFLVSGTLMRVYVLNIILTK